MTDRTIRPHLSVGRQVAAIAVAAALLAASCSSDSSDSSGTTVSTTTQAAATSECSQGATIDKVESVPVADTTTDHTVTSFDGTKIRAHWFPTTGTEPTPTILMGPGWSLPGDTSVSGGTAIFGALSIKGMLDRGYNVLTWDPRGFGKSTGNAQVNSAEAEGRDVQVLLDWVAARPSAKTDAKGDPRVGMVGFSYGGGIQLITAAIDCRVDAIVPGIAWHSLSTALFKHRTVKQGWSSVLVGSAAAGNLDPHITSASNSGRETGTLSAEDEAWFSDRGPATLVDKINVPTLFVQGTVDTLFTLDEAITNQASLIARGVPTAMLWFCGGHGVCLVDPGDTTRVTDASFAWLDRYLNGDTSASVVPAFETVDQDGASWTAAAYPDKADETVAAASASPATLALTTDSAAGAITVPPENTDLLGSLVAPITPSPAGTAVNLTVKTGAVDGLALGAPTVKLTYSGTTPNGPEPTRVFAQLIDETRKVIVGNQITPIPLTLDGKTHTTSVDLEVIAQYLRPGQTLTLQLVASTVAYAIPRVGGTVTFDRVSITIPVVTKGLTKS